MCKPGRFLCPHTPLSPLITSVDVSSPPSHLTPPPSSSFPTPAHPSAKHLQRPTVRQAHTAGWRHRLSAQADCPWKAHPLERENGSQRDSMVRWCLHYCYCYLFSFLLGGSLPCPPFSLLLLSETPQVSFSPLWVRRALQRTHTVLTCPEPS